MCDYLYPTPNDQRPHPHQVGITIPNYCQRASQFWVQATVTTHNMHACTHHLPRIVRDVEDASKRAIQAQKDGKEVPRSYFRWVKKDGTLYPRLFTNESHNWSYVTVKPYTRKAN